MVVVAALNVFIQATCFIAACYFLRNERSLPWRLQASYMLVMLFIEAMGGYLGAIAGEQNGWLYNLFIPIEACFVSYFMYRSLGPYGVKSRHWFLWLLLFATCYSAERMLVQNFQTYSYWSVMFIGLSFITGSIYYAQALVRSPPLPQKLHAHAPTLWMLAVGLFYFGSFVIVLFSEPLLTSRLTLFSIPLYSLVLFLVNLVLCSLWIYTFLCRYRSTHSSAS